MGRLMAVGLAGIGWAMGYGMGVGEGEGTFGVASVGRVAPLGAYLLKAKPIVLFWGEKTV